VYLRVDYKVGVGPAHSNTRIFVLWCSVLQCVAVCCIVLQCVAVCCSVYLRVDYKVGVGPAHSST